MGTRAHIIAKTSKGYERIYLHYDGYPTGAGFKLKNFYQTQKDVESLIALGNLSVLDMFTDPAEGHSFSAPVKGFCVAYGRDRGEKNQQAELLTFESFIDEFTGSWIEYTYYWDGEKWHLLGLENLDEAIAKDGRC